MMCEDKKKTVEGEKELQRVDMGIDNIVRELNSLPIQHATNTEWFSMLPWSITSCLIEEALLYYGIGIKSRVSAVQFES